MRSATLLALTLLAAGETLQARACDSPPQDPTPAVTPSPPSRSDGPVFTTQDGVRFRVEVVVASLEIPWAVVFAPDGRLFVTERPGRVQIVDITRQASQVALTLDDVFAEGEAGLLGLALDPSFASNGLVYLYYTARTSAGRPVNRVVRYRESGNRLGNESSSSTTFPRTSFMTAAGFASVQMASFTSPPAMPPPNSSRRTSRR